MSPRLLILLACCAASMPSPPTAHADETGIRVPEGFEVSLYADDRLAHDIFSMTLDAQGRVVVSGAGYVKTLHDDDGDGRADRASLFSRLPASGAHGMVFDGSDLICTGDNSVMRMSDADGDGQADGPGRVWTSLRNSEHGANGVTRGPDGCYYVICGNDAGVSTRQITSANSPVKHPRCGAVVRFSAEGKPLDVFADGFRNPYDLDFDASGHMFTVDSDGERDHHLPWYVPTRLFDIAQGQEHGWLLMGWTRGWNRPESFFDNVERLVEIGRGSPTGVTVYRHRAFPEHYRGGVLAACWTLGRVYYFPLQPDGASFRSSREVFMQTTGDVGFAPCDLAVGPQGELYVAIGGRHTRGSVFRVRYCQAADQPPAVPGVEQLLSAAQPLASWSRARWQPLARQLGKAAIERALTDEQRAASQRVRAMEILVELFGGLEPDLGRRCAGSSEPAVRDRTAWALGHSSVNKSSIATIARLTGDDHPGVQRAAWEALAIVGPIDAEVQPDWLRGLSSPLRRVRRAALAVAGGGGKTSYDHLLTRVRLRQDAWRLRLAQQWIARAAAADAVHLPLTAGDATVCLQAFAADINDRQLRLEVLRLLQLGLGDVRTGTGQAEVYCGYAADAARQVDPAARQSLVDALAKAFPTTDAEVNRELARLLGMLGANDARLLAELCKMWTPESSVESDLHYLIVASLLEGVRDSATTMATARCLLSLHRKLEAAEQFASRNWPFRVGETFEALCVRDPSLIHAMVESNQLNHVGQALFVSRLPRDIRPDASRRLWAATVDAGSEPTPEMIELIASLPPEWAFPRLRAYGDSLDLRDAVVLALARQPQAQDRVRFIAGLSSPQATVVEKSARALVPLGIHCTAAEIAAALRALKLACGQPKQTEPRGSLLKLLNFWTEENADVELDPNPSQAYVGWFEMFDRYYPAEAARLRASSGADATGWKRRLAAINWAAGEAGRGKSVFEARACHRCHQANGHLGPELAGAASRLSREDLFTAIFDPNLEVAPAYQTTLVATRAGQVYHGLVVYESPETTLLQTGPDTTVRVMNIETSSMRKSGQSLMPVGLLDPLSDQDLSDLYAFLRTLAK